MMFTRKNRFMKTLIAGVMVLSLLAMGGFGCGAPDVDDDPVKLSYQTWTEAMIVGEMFHIMLTEHTDIPIEVVELESFAIQWEAITNDEIDLMGTYTSTGYMTVLGDTGLRDPEEVYDYVKEELKDQYDIVVLDRIGFYNNYDLAVRPEIAEEYGLETYSDLAEVAGELTIAADVNFLDREDTYPLLQEMYGMEFGDIKTVGVTLKYPTIAEGEADVINNYTTDAQIQELGLVVLEDDLNAFPPYDKVSFARAEVLDMYPEIEEVMGRLAGMIDTDEMVAMNYAVEIEEKQPADVARDFLIEKGLIDG